GLPSAEGLRATPHPPLLLPRAGALGRPATAPPLREGGAPPPPPAAVLQRLAAVHHAGAGKLPEPLQGINRHSLCLRHYRASSSASRPRNSSSDTSGR